MTKTSLKKFNIIDVVIILVVVLAAAMLLGRGFSKNVTNSNTGKTIEYTVKVQGIRQPTFDALQQGDKLVDGATGNAIGEIFEISSEPYTENQNMLDGTVKALQVPDRLSAYVTITCEGVVNDDGYFLGSTQVAVGDTISLVSERVDTNGVIVAVKEK